MKLVELAQSVDARILTAASAARIIEIRHVCAGNRISDLLNEATEETLLVTGLANALLPRVAALMDAPAICLIDGCVPDAEVVDAAQEHQTALLVSPFGMQESYDQLLKCLETSVSTNR